jgi:uracil-DNA glycosylase family 4
MTLRRELETCTKCEWLVPKRKAVVMAEGICPTDIMFLCSSPKDREETQSQPFAGLSGKFFRSTTQYVFNNQFRLSYLCTIMCKTPKREATDVEISNCRSNIIKQINLFNPKVIVALGKTAQAFILNCPLEKTSHSLVGTLSEFKLKSKTIPVIITFDPQQVLKDRPKLESIFVRHLRAAMKLTFAF